MIKRIKLKNSNVQGKVPTIQDLELGELAINTYDGKIYMKKHDTVDSISEISGNSTGLEKINEGNGEGWRLSGQNPDNYGNIGQNAVDLSISDIVSTTNGATGDYSHAEGGRTTAEGDFSHAEGSNTNAEGKYSHAEGCATSASGYYSHAENGCTTASGCASHAEGNQTVASGCISHAEGYSSHAEGCYSHAEGYSSHAEGCISHAEGHYTIASGKSSHAENGCTTASGNNSHAEGYYTISQNEYQHSAGMYNIGTSTETIHETGIGVDNSNRKNAFEIYTNGTLTAPESTITNINNRGDKSLTTKEYVDSNISTLPGYGESGGNITAADIDLLNGNIWYKTITADITFTFTNTHSLTGFTLVLTNAGSYNITWPTSVKWPGGNIPTLSTGIDVLSFTTIDGGSSWFGMSQVNFS